MTQNNRSPWDAGRFIKTLSYFEVIPFLSCLQRLFTGRANNQQSSQGRGKDMGVILVAGATGGVGKRVVRCLVERNYPVRALVRNAQKAREILGNNLELFEADITIPDTLTPALYKNITAIVCCTGARMQPVEGDTPNREKYDQGIKFYRPEVVDSPELLEYQGIKNLVQAAAEYLEPGKQLLFDFQNPSDDLQETWGAVDDVVMGGVSESSIRLIDKAALFTGNVSTANSGGFVSVRTRNLPTPLNLAEYQGLELRVKGDGQRYKFILRNESKWDGIAYCYSFDTQKDQWINVSIPFADLIPVFRAKTLKDAAPFNPSRIFAIQLMLSKFEYDGALNPNFAPGSFVLQLETIKAYGGITKPQFIMISSAGVTRPGRPGINLEEEPPAVRMNDQLGGILTWKLRGEDAVRDSGVSYTIIRPCALTEEPGGQALVFAQGDNIRGKVSREDIAELCIQVLEQPKACNVTFEVKEASDGLRDWQTLFCDINTDSN
ncbi:MULTISPECIES: CIA30 family protein [Moorena]|uniref:Complex I intermediate-associated protein, NmrA-like family n=1 Tax=Moorena producens 3L TaxID=489825 RepID=F4XR29_9CYAN|nr:MULTISPECIES: CIA30 family protein [Moorena]NEQ16056.1 NAD(P)H-binding protein [Moorena sp. SIO3E2]EGJ33004.1 complex I intermediate-associated protein, NmrA-like family [Moorena producens 3L]NEP36555.1 NAD(P)H-binding protein [Moorena sp. SIO3B2]NEP68405.1 NAD(P)H-binding protein [Moorena sp. SIO3A5]NEQ10494.1 NAD(P)H-binding protein [Moorena sp. SIO4E2]